jgi:hypothetical protein
MRIKIIDTRKPVTVKAKNPRSISREVAERMIRARGESKGILDTRDKLIAAGFLTPKGVK